MLTRRSSLKLGILGAISCIAREFAASAAERRPAWQNWDSATRPARGGYYRRAAVLDVGLLNPNHWPVNDWLVINQFYEKLLITDGSFRPTPWLAESWTFPDQVTCLMKLRKGVQFADETPVNAAAGQCAM